MGTFYRQILKTGGTGEKETRRILAGVGVSVYTRGEIGKEKEEKIRKEILKVQSKREGGEIEKMKKIENYRGWRHKLSMPVRGQRTRSNGKTAKKLNKGK